MGRRVSRGYILLETLIALSILGISMVGLHRSVREALFVQGRTQDFTRAKFLMEEIVNEITLQPQMTVSMEEGTFPNYPRFNYAWEYTEYPVPVPSGRPSGMSEDEYATLLEQFKGQMGKLTVTISWYRAGQPFSRTVETLFKPEHLWISNFQF